MQLERWERLVAQHLNAVMKKDDNGHVYWEASIERHFLLIAAHQLISAMQFVQFPVHIEETIRVELPAARDLVEHWRENMPIFNVTPRPGDPPRASGNAFADRNPRGGPYDAAAWDNQVGPKVLPNVPATALRDLVVAVKARLAKDWPNYTHFMKDGWNPSPWYGGEELSGRWWPKV